MLKVSAAAFAVGFITIGLFLFILAFATATFADIRGRGSFRVGAGVLTSIEHRVTSRSTDTLFGPGIVALAALGGLLNAGASVILRNYIKSRQHPEQARR